MPPLNRIQRLFLAGVGWVILLLQLYKFSEDGVGGASWIFAFAIVALLWLPAMSNFKMPQRRARQLQGATEKLPLNKTHQSVGEERTKSKRPLWMFFFLGWIALSSALLVVGFFQLLPDAGSSTPSINSVLTLKPVLFRLLRVVLYSIGVVFTIRSSSGSRFNWIWILIVTIPIIWWQLIRDVQYDMVTQEPARAASEARSDSVLLGRCPSSPNYYESMFCKFSQDPARQPEVRDRLERAERLPKRALTYPSGSLPLASFPLEIIAIAEMVLSLGFAIVWVRARNLFASDASPRAT